MAIQTCRLGSLPDILQYDDVDYDCAIETDQPMKAGAPVDPTDVLRLEDLGLLEIITSDAVIADHAIVRGDGGARKIQDSGVLISDTGGVTIPDGLTIGSATTPTIVELAATAVNIGDGGTTHYTSIGVTGLLTMVGDARVERILESMVISGRGVSAPTQRTTEVPYLSYTFSIGNDVHQTFEAPYNMDYTYDSWIKVHWYTHVAQTDDEVNWQCIWNANAEAGGEAVNAGSTTDSTGDVSCPTQWEIEETLIETIPANSIAEGDIVGIAVERIAVVGSDPDAGSIHVLSIEYEYVSNKLGKGI